MLSYNEEDFLSFLTSHDLPTRYHDSALAVYRSHHDVTHTDGDEDEAVCLQAEQCADLSENDDEPCNNNELVVSNDNDTGDAAVINNANVESVGMDDVDDVIGKIYSTDNGKMCCNNNDLTNNCENMINGNHVMYEDGNYEKEKSENVLTFDH